MDAISNPADRASPHQIVRRFLASPTLLASVLLPQIATGLPAMNTGAIDEVVVTARKRSESIGDVPVAITAFTGDDLRARGISSIRDLATISPGISIREDVAGRASPSVVIRGVGYDDFRPNGSPAAAVHVDETYLGSNALIGSAMFDVERLEVLKGPQGTLYGRNTTAGAVNIITRKPGDTLEVNGSMEYGNYNSLRIDAGIGGPLNDVIGLRLAGIFQGGGGFLTNKGNAAFAGSSPAPGTVPGLSLTPEADNVGDADYGALRGTLVISPSDETEITVQANYGRDRGDNSQSDVLGISATGYAEPDTDPYTFYANYIPHIHSDQFGLNTKLVHELSFTTLTALASYQDLDRTYDFDPGDPRRAFDLEYSDQLKQYTAEVRLNGSAGSAIDWTSGFFYFQDNIAFDSLLDAADLVATQFGTDYQQKRSSWAVFGETDIALSDTVTATIGLRYTEERSRFYGETVDLDPWGVSFGPFAFPGLPAVFDNKFDDDNLSGRLQLSYKPSEDLMLYTSVSRGFKSGGFDGSTIFSAPEALPFGSEQVTAYEVGTKWYPLDYPVSLTASGFYYDFNDLQANTVRNIGLISTSVRTNVANAEIYGAETELTWRPVPELTLRGSVSLLNSEVKKFISSNSAEIKRREGNPLPDAPSVSWNVNAAYVFDLPDGWTLTTYGEANYVSKTYKELDNYSASPSYTLLNARLTLTSSDSRYQAGLYGRNLSDETYFVGLIPAASGAGVLNGVQRIVGAPRTYGLFVGMQF